MTVQKANREVRDPSHDWADGSRALGDHESGAHCTRCNAAYCLFCTPEANDSFGTLWRNPCAGKKGS